MSYPAALKNFLELCSIFNATFKSDDKTCYGNCKVEKLLYITTRGMDISTGDPLEQATPYLKALSWLWGIGPMDVIATQNMDYVSEDENQKESATGYKNRITSCRKLVNRLISTNRKGVKQYVGIYVFGKREI